MPESLKWKSEIKKGFHFKESLVIENHRVLEIIRLIDSRQYSQRQIASKLKVSRGTVSSIMKGIRKFRFKIAQEINIKPEGPIVRCPKCGGKTQLPCTYCEIKKIIEQSHVPVKQEVKADDSQSLEVMLMPKHHKRYLEIRAWREKQANPYYAVLPDNWPWKKRNIKENDATSETNLNNVNNQKNKSNKQYVNFFQDEINTDVHAKTGIEKSRVENCSQI
ncbi:MAG: helix-turn-helix domain-containing protein [Thermoguttaceae bacterium]